MDVQTIEACLTRLGTAVQQDPELLAACAGTLRAYFGPNQGRGRDATAVRRHLEWFLCEQSSGSGLVLDDVWLRHGEALDLDDDCRRALRDSHTGVFEVTGVRTGEGFWLRDLGSLGEYPVRESEASALVQVGDVVAGRLYPLGNGDHALARSAFVRRSPSLLQALRADLSEARKERRGVVRIGGSELEAMFAPPADPEVDPVAAARKLLASSGAAPADIERWMQDLAQAPFDPRRIVHGADDALAPILDALAFDTSVDLDEARRVLIAAWHSLTRLGPGQGASLVPASAPGGEVQVETALARFRQGTQEGRPLSQMLDELERELDISIEPDEDELAPAPDFPGVVGAMVTEFLWETAAEHGVQAAAELRSLETLGESAREVGVFETLTPLDLARWAGVHVVEAEIVRGAGEAQALVAALRRFVRWAREVHEVDLGAAGDALLKRLEAELPRIAEANARRTRAGKGGGMHRLRALSEDGLAELECEGELVAARIDMVLAEWLRPGDLLRGRVDDEGRLAVYAAHPNLNPA